MKPTHTPLDLEFALRDFFGFIDEPIDVDAATLAKAVRGIAIEDGLDLAAHSVLMAIVAGLTDRHSGWQLTLTNRQSGRRPLHHHREEQQARDFDVFVEVENAAAQHGSVESAIKEVATTRAMARSSVFQARKRFQDRQRMSDRFAASLAPLQRLDINGNSETAISSPSVVTNEISASLIKSGSVQTEKYTWTACFAPLLTPEKRSE